MDIIDLRNKKVKDIVFENSATASVFFRFGIDYCNGNISLEDDCIERYK